MSNTSEPVRNALFHALADGTRRDILRRLLVQELSVTELARAYSMSFAAVQKHVAMLERAGLIHKRRRGREQLARGDVETIRTVAGMLAELEEVWRGRLASIDDVLAEPNETTNTSNETMNASNETTNELEQ